MLEKDGTVPASTFYQSDKGLFLMRSKVIMVHIFPITLVNQMLNWWLSIFPGHQYVLLEY